MLKLSGVGQRKDGRSFQLIVLGLSHENLKRLKQDKPIIVRGEEVGLPEAEILIFSGRTEAAMMRELESLVGPNTTVRMDKRTTDA